MRIEGGQYVKVVNGITARYGPAYGSGGTIDRGSEKCCGIFTAVVTCLAFTGVSVATLVLGKQSAKEAAAATDNDVKQGDESFAQTNYIVSGVFFAAAVCACFGAIYWIKASCSQGNSPNERNGLRV
jgi:hypothetical protein